MPSFTMDATISVIDPDAFDNVVNLWQEAVMRAGVRRFLAATLKRIPVRTGFLRGSFSQIRKFFRDESDPGILTVNRAIGRSRRREFYHYGRSRVLKTPTSGIPFASRPEDVLTFTGRGSTFKLVVDIDYYRVNDFFGVIAGAPWESLQEGAAAMTNYLGKIAETFPDITEIAATQTIRLRGTSVTVSQSAADVAATRFLKITGF